MIYVPGGSFMMGDGAFTEDLAGHKTKDYWLGEYDMKPAHKVTLDGYYLSKFEVTNEEFLIYVNANKKIWNDRPPKYAFDGFPVVAPNWYEAKNYCTWLGKISGLPFDLPSEAQWEYAARSGGKNYVFPTDNGKLEFGRNIKMNRTIAKRSNQEQLTLAPVGSNPPNPMGFHEMAANIAEWVNDWYYSKYYRKSPEHNPTGPEKSPYKTKPWKVFRGTNNVNSDSVTGNFMTIKRGTRLPESAQNGFRCSIQMPEKLSKSALIQKAIH